MRDERLDYSYRAYRTEPYKVSKERLKQSIRLQYFHFGRSVEGARDQVARDAYDLYVVKHAGSDSIYDFGGEE